VVAVVVSQPVVGVDLKSATSAQRSATSHVTAQRLVDTAVADLAANKADTVVAVDSAVDVKEDKPATLAVATATCLVTVPKDKSAITAAKSAISPETAPPKPPPSVPAISASNPATSKPNAPTKCTNDIQSMDRSRASENEMIRPILLHGRRSAKAYSNLARIKRRYPGHLERVACSKHQKLI